MAPFFAYRDVGRSQASMLFSVLVHPARVCRATY